MVKRYHYALVAVVASSISLSAAYPSSAADGGFMNMMKDFLAKQAQPQNTDPIATRETDISNRMIDAIRANKLTAEQTSTLKFQFDNIKALETRYRADGNLDSIENASLNAELTRLDGTFNAMIAAPTGATTTTVQTGTVSTSNVNQGPRGVDVSMARLQKLSKDLTNNLANGRLTLDEAKSLKFDFDRIVSEGTAKIASGSQSQQDILQIDGMMDALQKKITANTHDKQVWPGIDGQQAILMGRIDQAMRDNKVSNREYNDLKTESDRIAQMETNARKDGLQLAETIALATDITNFRARIDSRLGYGDVANGRFPNGGGYGGGFPGGGGYGGGFPGGPGGFPGGPGGFPGGPGGPGGPGPWGGPSGGPNGSIGQTYDLRKEEITRRIDRGVDRGRLTQQEATDLRKDLARLEQMVAYYRGRPGGITAANIAVLDRGRDNLVTELTTKLHDDNTASVPQGSNIDRKQTELKSRIDNGVASGKLTASEAGNLRSQLEWIDSVELSMRHSGGRIDPTEEQQLLSDLGRVEDKINRKLGNGNTGTPGTNVPGNQNNIAAIESKKSDIQKRVNDGIANKQLDRFETQMIGNEMNRINWMQQRLTKNGTLDPGDQIRILAELNKLNDTVTRELQDRKFVGNDGWGHRQ